ncbi:translocase of chloroplast 159, chloroplastic [Tanacetum coccineum]
MAKATMSFKIIKPHIHHNATRMESKSVEILRILRSRSCKDKKDPGIAILTISSQEETEYHSNDFDWEELRQQIENDPTLTYHFQPFTRHYHQSVMSSSLDSQSWNQFHSRHSTGKFFKIFTLSAMPLDRMSTSVKCFSVLKPGLYDMTMLRFEADQRVGFREYKLADVTRSYFFSLDSTRDLFLGRQTGQAFRLDAAKQKATELEADGSDDLDFGLNILAIGKAGVGKSATINSIFGEDKTSISAFQPATGSVKEISGMVGGVPIRVFDTPGFKSSIMEQGYNKEIYKEEPA